MNERQLESFILSADEKSKSKRTKSYISTPALVQQINLLEKALGLNFSIEAIKEFL